MKKIFTSNIIIIKNGKYLLQLRSGNKTKVKENNTWGLFGGHCKKNEKSKECVCREIKEETNLIIKNPKLEFRVFINKYQAKVSIFSKKIKKMGNFKLSEGTGYKFFTKQEIMGKKTSEIKILQISWVLHYFYIQYFLQKNLNLLRK